MGECQKSNDLLEEMEIIKNEKIALNVFKMIVHGEIVKEMKQPGQFVMVGMDGYKGLTLRRPISICEIDHKNEYLTIIYKVLGEGTEYISKKKTGETLDVFGPLGKGFPVEATKTNQKALLIGGGVGVPPLFELAKQLNQNNIEVISVLGFQTKDDVFYHEEFEQYSKVYLCTNDGSAGYKGYVTEIIKSNAIDFNCLYGCGPNLMLKAINDQYLDDINNGYRDGYLSFEEKMACGTGACLGCAIPKYNEDGYARVCKDGPVFKLGGIKPWK